MITALALALQLLLAADGDCYFVTNTRTLAARRAVAAAEARLERAGRCDAPALPAD